METIDQNRIAKPRVGWVVCGVLAVALLAAGGFYAFRDTSEPCYQTTMNTPGPDPKPTAEAAAMSFLTLDGWPDEFVDDLGQYEQTATAEGIEFATGGSPSAEFRAIESGAGWIVVGVALTCPT